MGFFIKKSFGKGPVRITMSSRGVSWSIGANGFRIGSYTSKSRRKKDKKKVEKPKKIQPEIINSSPPIKVNPKIFAWICRICYLPMIVGGGLICLISKWGFLFIAIGLAELIYRINFFAPKIERWENKDGTN